jgi:hypothetical protein
MLKNIEFPLGMHVNQRMEFARVEKAANIPETQYLGSFHFKIPVMTLCQWV